MAQYEIDKKALMTILGVDDLKEFVRSSSQGVGEIVVGQIIRVFNDRSSSRGGEFAIDVFEESPDNTDMDGRYYTNKEIENIKAAARADAFKEASIAGLSAQSGIPIAELEANWSNGKFDGSKGKALKEQWRKSIESYAKRCGVDPKDLRGREVSAEEFKKKFG